MPTTSAFTACRSHTHCKVWLPATLFVCYRAPPLLHSHAHLLAHLQGTHHVHLPPSASIPMHAHPIPCLLQAHFICHTHPFHSRACPLLALLCTHTCSVASCSIPLPCPSQGHPLLHLLCRCTSLRVGGSMLHLLHRAPILLTYPSHQPHVLPRISPAGAAAPSTSVFHLTNSLPLPCVPPTVPAAPHLRPSCSCWPPHPCVQPDPQLPAASCPYYRSCCPA